MSQPVCKLAAESDAEPIGTMSMMYMTGTDWLRFMCLNDQSHEL